MCPSAWVGNTECLHSAVTRVDVCFACGAWARSKDKAVSLCYVCLSDCLRMCLFDLQGVCLSVCTRVFNFIKSVFHCLREHFSVFMSMSVFICLLVFVWLFKVMFDKMCIHLTIQEVCKWVCVWLSKSKNKKSFCKRDVMKLFVHHFISLKKKIILWN